MIISWKRSFYEIFQAIIQTTILIKFDAFLKKIDHTVEEYPKCLVFKGVGISVANYFKS